MSMSVTFYLNCYFSVRLSLILMQHAMNDMRTRVYRVTDQILNIFMNYANQVKGAHKMQ